jgi:hypothetical protein
VATHLTRKALLKRDKFTVEVEHTVDFFAAHRPQVIRYGGIVLAVAVIVAGIWYYRNSQLGVRQQALGEAIQLTNAPVGQAPPNGGPNFPNQAAKNDAVAKAFNRIMSDYRGSDEAYIAEYFLAGQSAATGNLGDARRKYQDVADHAKPNYSSLAKLALADINVVENRGSEGERLLKDLIDHPTDLVSKNQATISYAKMIAPTRPEEARKLLLPIASAPSDISSIASQALAELPPPKK